MRTLFTFEKDDDPEFPNARWRMKTHISLRENIPQLILIFAELFYKGKTITCVECFFAL